MSAKRNAEPASAQTVLPVAVPALAVILDLPAGTEVVTAVIEGDQLLLTLAGVDWASVRGWDAKRGARTPEQITADYSVDAHGHRSLTALAMPADDSGGIADEPPPDPDPTEEKE